MDLTHGSNAQKAGRALDPVLEQVLDSCFLILDSCEPNSGRKNSRKSAIFQSSWNGRKFGIFQKKVDFVPYPLITAYNGFHTEKRLGQW